MKKLISLRLITYKIIDDLVYKQSIFRRRPKQPRRCPKIVYDQGYIFCSNAKPKYYSRKWTAKFFDETLNSHAFSIS